MSLCFKYLTSGFLSLVFSLMVFSRGMPLYKMDDDLALPFEHGITQKKHKSIQNVNIKTQQTNKRTDKGTGTKVGVMRGSSCSQNPTN